MRYLIRVETTDKEVALRIRKRLEKDPDYRSQEFVMLQGPLERCDRCLGRE